VKDEGIGMSQDQLTHVYERFWRADNSGNIPGTGLGMAISAEIMRLMNGYMDITSQLNVGTTVTIWLKQKD